MSEEDIAVKMQNMFRTIYEAIDLKYMRPFKRDMFKCAHGCLDDTKKPLDAERCIDDCGATLQKAMTVVQNEVNAFQGRIDRCLMDCQDTVRNEKEESRARKLFENCADNCVVKFLPVVTGVSSAICEQLEKIKRDAR